MTRYLFVATLLVGLACLGTSGEAKAHDDCCYSYSYGAYYAPAYYYRPAYYVAPVYHTYYRRAYSFYTPRVSYYSGYYARPYGYHYPRASFYAGYGFRYPRYHYRYHWHY